MSDELYTHWYKPAYITSDSVCHLPSSVVANVAVAGICETDGLAARHSCPPPPRARVYCDEWEADCKRFPALPGGVCTYHGLLTCALVPLGICLFTFDHWCTRVCILKLADTSCTSLVVVNDVCVFYAFDRWHGTVAISSNFAATR